MTDELQKLQLSVHCLEDHAREMQDAMRALLFVLMEHNEIVRYRNTPNAWTRSGQLVRKKSKRVFH